MQYDAHSDAPPEIRVGGEADYVDIRLEDGILAITVVGAPAGQLIHDAIQAGLQQGWLQPGIPTLVDVGDFQGNVDWQAMLTISRMTDWSQGKTVTAKVAYLTNDPLFSLLIKAVSTLFPDSRHRLFQDTGHARQWLMANAA
ncbi:hypothetical protein [Ferrovibrio sp.]|jgi:hypothetical protein|uniref:hypothetical protein n=1 Tax=Ferrovibrio sp. TaxID=1917215 RepID=UPI0035B3F9E6